MIEQYRRFLPPVRSSSINLQQILQSGQYSLAACMITCITIDINGFERKKNSGMIVIIVLIAEKVFSLH